MKGGAYARRDGHQHELAAPEFIASMKGGAYARRDCTLSARTRAPLTSLDEGRRVRAPRFGGSWLSTSALASLDEGRRVRAPRSGRRLPRAGAARASMKGGAYARRDDSTPPVMSERAQP